MTITSNSVVAQFKGETIETLDSHLPTTANLGNLDEVIRDAAADRYENAVADGTKDDDVDAWFIILTLQSMAESEITAQSALKQRIFRSLHTTRTQWRSRTGPVESLSHPQISSLDPA